MSYDLHIASRESIENELAAVDEYDPEAEVLNPGRPVAEIEAKKRELADRIRSANPQLQPFEFDFREVAEFLGSSEEEARLRYRHIELNGADDGNGIQVTIYDDHVGITVPYWHSGDAARAVIDEIWRYLQIIEQATGYVTYDGQVGKVLGLSVDKPEVLRAYIGVIDRLPEIIASAEFDHTGLKPWWKFW